MEGTRGEIFSIFGKIKQIFDKDYVEVYPQKRGKKSLSAWC